MRVYPIEDEGVDAYHYGGAGHGNGEKGWKWNAFMHCVRVLEGKVHQGEGLMEGLDGIEGEEGECEDDDYYVVEYVPAECKRT